MSECNATMQEHIVRIAITIHEKTIEYKVDLKTELPLFKVHHGMGEFDYISMENETTFYIKPSKLARKLRRKMLQAQKRYNAILKLREDGQAGSHKCNLTHKL